MVDITLTKHYSDLDIIKRTFKYISPVKGKFILGFLLIVINVILNILIPFIVGSYMDVLKVENLATQSIIYICLFCGSYLLVIIANVVLTYYEVMVIQKAGQEVVFTLRQAVFEKIESFSHDQLSNIPIGRLVTRVNSDTNALNELYTNVLVNLLKYILMVIGFFAFMIYVNPLITLYMLIFIALIIFVTLMYRHYSQKAFSNERKEVSNLNTFLSENLNGMKIIQIFNQEQRKYQEFENGNRKLVKANKFVMFVFAVYRPTITLLYYLALALVFFLGFKMVVDGRVFFGSLFTFGRLTTYYQFTDSFFGPIQNIAEQFDKLQAGIVSSGRIFNILDMDSTIVDEGKKEIEYFNGKIEFKHVYFAYKDEEWILKDVSFVVKPHQTVAFVGATGAGKTTILSLIVRNYDIQKGQILIDDIDIKDIPLNILRRKIGQMLQDVFMFSGTVKDNIVLRDETITDEEVNRAIKYVNADQFISHLKDGLNTEVSENGSNFSSGQRQLISFARTIIRKPEILILDEATANIDTETEKLIQDSLNKMKTIGTMLIVAHRLSTIQHADNIICLMHGEIIEQGNHQELLKKKGYYYKLYLLQYESNQKTVL